MKKLTFWKSLFLLFALIVGSTNAWAQAPVNTVLWAEDFSGYSNKTVPSGEISNSHTGTTVYDSGNVTYACADGGTTTQVYVDTNGPHTDANNANLLISKGNGTFTVSGIPTGSATELTLSYEKSGKGTLSVSTSTAGVTISGSTITTNGASTIALTFKNTNNSNNLRIDDISLIVKTAGSSTSKTATTTTISATGIANTDLKNGTAAGSLSASVTVTEGGATVSGAIVKWSSDDEDVAKVNETSGVVTLVGVGSAIITASYDGDDTYAESSDTYELTVTDTRTATITTIDDAGITNTDLKNGTAAGTLTAGVTAGGDPVLGATVTWESSDPTVATITDGGVVTLVKVGTTTITASYAGGGSYAASSGTYVLNVVNTEQQNPVTIQMTNSLFGQEVYTSSTKSKEELTFIGYQDNVKVTYYVPDNSNYYFNTSNTRPYNTCTLTYGAPAGYVITEIDFTSDGSNWKTATPSVGEMTATKKWEGFDKEVTFSWEESGTRVKTVVVTLAEVVTLTPAKTYTTLTSAYPLDFTNVSGLKAFIAKDGVSEGSVKMAQVNKVPANTGLVLKATTPNSAVNVPVFDGTGADDVSGNLMKGSATETTAIEKDGGYILSNGVFQPASAGTLAAGKAYLQFAVTSARSLEMSFDDATTAINGIEEVASVNVKTRKVVKNGRLVIETANGEFTIDGARMK